MQKRAIKYILSVALLLFVAYNSVYFKKLDEVKAKSVSKQFDAMVYATNFYNKKLLPNLGKAMEVSTLIELVKNEPEKAFAEHSQALGIGNIRYFLVKGEGVITAINENTTTLAVKSDTTTKAIEITTEFVYGNAIRDASGQIDINEFTSTMDFNNVSAEINKIVRTKVLPDFKQHANKGDVVKFSGALELNKAHLNVDDIEVVPIALEIKK